MVRSWDVAADLPPIDVRPLLPRERAKLFELLAGLRGSDWTRATACPGWNVHDVALHLLGNDIGRLGPPAGSEARSGKLDFLSLAGVIEQSNEDWVRTARRIPPSLLIEFLALSGPGVDAAFARLDMGTEGVAVAWTGTGPSPYWLDVAREYTERWVHHQQIRQALGRPALLGRRWLHPVLATFMRALPLAYESRFRQLPELASQSWSMAPQGAGGSFGVAMSAGSSSPTMGGPLIAKSASARTPPGGSGRALPKSMKRRVPSPSQVTRTSASRQFAWWR